MAPEKKGAFQPEIDILMATFNGEKYITEQIESVIAQRDGDWRLFVSDDCSSDSTCEMVRSLALRDERIHLIACGKKGGARDNFISLLSETDADYVMFCDQDDVWLDSKVSVLRGKLLELEQLYGKERPLMVFSDMKVVDSSLNVISDSFFRYEGIDPARTKLEYVVAQAVAPGCTMLFNRSLLELATQSFKGSLEERDEIIMHDWWLMILVAAFGRVDYVSEPLALYRQHGGNEVGASGFSVGNYFGNFTGMVDSISRSVRQCRLFLNIYDSAIPEEEASNLELYASSMTGGSCARLIALFRSGCWKRGLRKAGQIMVALSGDRGMRSR